MQGNFVNGWREVLARVFDGFEIEYGVTPDWLVNPDTHRRLKLDYLLPEIGLAVRFIGLEGTQRKSRKSDLEVTAEQDRDLARQEVCRAHGVTLVGLDPDGEPKVALRELERGLSRASAAFAQGDAPHALKQKVMPRISAARQRVGDFTTRLVPIERLNMYAEMWSERQSNLSAQAAAAKKPSGIAPSFEVGMEVVHERFGGGMVTAMEPDGQDVAITVDFVSSGVRQLLASLVGDKMQPV